MGQWFPLFLLLHVLAAIVAFGPSFAFPLISRMGAAEREHVNFSVRVGAAITRRITIPAALTMPVSGALMIWATGLSWSQFWLASGVALYVIAILFAVLVQLPNVERLAAMTAVGGPPEATAGGPPPGAAAGGPPPALAATIRRVQLGGLFLTVLIVVIVTLMVGRPTI